MRWGTDLTETWTLQDRSVSVLLTVDHHTPGILGIHAAKRATRWGALESVRQTVRRSLSGIAEQIAVGVELRHDNGSLYISDAFQEEIAFLGLRSRPASVRAPEDNGSAERAIRTLKEQLL